MQHVLAGFDPFDRRTGNGSRSAEEDWLDQHTTAGENQWSTASTTFYVSEAPAHKQRQFQDLYDEHHGKGERNRRATLRRSHIVSDAETFTVILGMPEYQRERVISIAEEMDFSSEQFGGKPYEKVLLAICSLISDKALSRNVEQENADTVANKRLVLTDEFKELMDANNLGSREHNQIRNTIREKTDYF